MRTINYTILSFFLLVNVGCEDVKEGFISDHITYSQNPFNVTQGRVALSNAVVADGSTLPLRVKLLAIRDKNTGLPATALMQEYETPIFQSQISPMDTTLELVSSRVTRRMVPVFRINEIGGQLQFSPETFDVPVGEYTIDVEVSNDAGAKVFKDICTIRINAGNIIPAITGSAIAVSRALDGNGNPVLQQQTFGVGVTVNREDPESTNSIKFKFVDIDGDVIDPVKYGLREYVADAATEYKFSSATPWLKGNPESITNELVNYTFPVVPFPYTWIANGRAFRFSFMPTESAYTEFKDKTGYESFDVRINTGFRFTYDGAYTVTVKCDFINI